VAAAASARHAAADGALAAAADRERALTLHERAHALCFIAQSVNFSGQLPPADRARSGGERALAVSRENFRNCSGSSTSLWRSSAMAACRSSRSCADAQPIAADLRLDLSLDSFSVLTSFLAGPARSLLDRDLATRLGHVRLHLSELETAGSMPRAARRRRRISSS